jgi:hypothetical protein
MKPQFDNQISSSFLMWFDHTLLSKGEAYYNVTTSFPANTSYVNGFYAYNGPYKGLVYDTSIAGATVMTGVTVNNANYNLGQNPVSGINYSEGQVYLASGNLNVTGTYSVKEFNVLLTSQPEEVLLFETQYVRRNKTPATSLKDSLKENTITYPVVFIKNNGSTNDPWAFGGTDETRIDFRAIVIADSQYTLDAVCSLFRDRNYDNVPLIDPTYNPFNVLGSFKSGVAFNYDNITSGKDYCMIDRVSVSKIAGVRDRENNINPGSYYGLIDFELVKFRQPRQT